MKVFLIFMGLLLVNCASNTPEPETIPAKTQVYRYSFDDVWRAIQVSLQSYPIKVNNSEKGIIHTEFINEGEHWRSPNKGPDSSARYQLKLRALKGAIQSKPAIKVTIDKINRKRKNFIDGSKEELGKDHLEESVILYRIKRELIINHALNKLQQKE